MHKRIDELKPNEAAQSQSPSAKTESRSESSDGAEKSGNGVENATSSGDGESSPKGKGGQGEHFQGRGKDSSKEPETEEEKVRRQEVQALENTSTSITGELMSCVQFYHVIGDSRADSGRMPDTPGEERLFGSGGDAAAE